MGNTDIYAQLLPRTISVLISHNAMPLMHYLLRTVPPLDLKTKTMIHSHTFEAIFFGCAHLMPPSHLTLAQPKITS
jgi:hypothetical protein